MKKKKREQREGHSGRTKLDGGALELLQREAYVLLDPGAGLLPERVPAYLFIYFAFL
jgi:hypothetical protein